MDGEPYPEQEKGCGNRERDLWVAYCGPDFQSDHLLSGPELDVVVLNEPPFYCVGALER